jgi:RNA polymerase sigma factor (TIGR02999 family)
MLGERTQEPACPGATSLAPHDAVEAVYTELRALAERAMRLERPDHTLQPTAVVHEAVVRLYRQGLFADAPRAQLIAVASLMIRRVLVDHARARRARKRGGAARRITVTDAAASMSPGPEVDLLALDDALHRLEAVEPRKAQVVQLRFFGGLTVEQVAAVLNLSPRAVANDWSFARAWLRREVEGATHQC